jgi:hypothetical protein
MKIAFTGSKITSVTDSALRVWQFAYPAGKLMVTDPETNVTEFDYGATSGPIESVVRTLSSLKPDGSKTSQPVTWSLSYADGRVSSVTNPAPDATHIPTPTLFAYGDDSYVTSQTTVTTPGDSVSGTPSLETTYNLNSNAKGWVDSVVTPVVQGDPEVLIQLTSSFELGLPRFDGQIR